MAVGSSSNLVQFQDSERVAGQTLCAVQKQRNSLAKESGKAAAQQQTMMTMMTMKTQRAMQH